MFGGSGIAIRFCRVNGLPFLLHLDDLVVIEIEFLLLATDGVVGGSLDVDELLVVAFELLVKFMLLTFQIGDLSLEVLQRNIPLVYTEVEYGGRRSGTSGESAHYEPNGLEIHGYSLIE